MGSPIIDSSRSLAVILGASRYPKSPELPAGPIFSNSAKAVSEYLANPQGWALPEKTGILDLFDDPRPPNELLEEMAVFLSARNKGRNDDTNLSDLLIYYVGHGGFTSGKDYFLAVQSTNHRSEGASSIRVSDLAGVVKASAPFVRRYLIFDCCFSATAFQSFQSSGPAAVAREKTLYEFPTRGTTMLCSSSSRDASLAPSGESRTMFTDALIKALLEGKPSLGPYISFNELGILVLEQLQSKHPLDLVRPQVLSPEQSEGDIAYLAIFPNQAYGMAKVDSAGSPKLPPRPASFFGRERSVADLVEVILLDRPLPTPILGSPGVGKSTVALFVLYVQAVVDRFSARRYFVRCDGVLSRDALVATISGTLGVEPGPHLEERLFQYLKQASTVLVLDNADTPWEADRGSVDELFGHLASVPHLALIASFRGEQQPGGTTWREAVLLRPLAIEPAREAFVAISGERHRRDPYLDPLLNDAAQRLPIAIVLLAREAEVLPNIGKPNLDDLWKRWLHAQSVLLAEGTTADMNIEIATSVTLQGPRMTPHALILASLLAVLPVGAADSDLPALLLEGSASAASTLRKIGWAAPDTPRLRLLLPIREILRRRHPPGPADRLRLVAHFIGLSYLGTSVGPDEGAEAVRRLTPEIGNLEPILSSVFQGRDPRPAIEAVLAIAELQRFTDIGDYRLLKCAIEAAKPENLALHRARCYRALGNFSLERSDHGTGRSSYNEARAIFHRAGDNQGEADCIKGLGDFAYQLSDYNTARSLVDEALPLYRAANDIYGEANCIMSSAHVALRLSEYDAARSRYHEARSLFHGLASPRGEAICILGLGTIARRCLDHDNARILLDQALVIFHRIGSVIDEASCVDNLADIALVTSDYDEALRRYEEAFALYRRVGSVVGQANCKLGIGSIALELSEFDTARSNLEQALSTYHSAGVVVGEASCIEKLGDLAYGMGNVPQARELFEKAIGLATRASAPDLVGVAHQRLAGLSENDSQRGEHLAAAIKAMRLAGQPHLTAELEQQLAALASRREHPL